MSAGGVHAVTRSDGTARIAVRRSKPGTLGVTATKQRLPAGRASVAIVRG